jgi:hypothetical protein
MKGIDMKKLLLALALIAPLANAQTLTVREVSSTGLNIRTVGATPSSTLQFPNDGRTILTLHNNGTSNVTATVLSPISAVNVPGYGLVTVTGTEVTIPSSSVVVIGPFPQSRWSGSNGVQVALTSTTLISATAVRTLQ